MLSRHAIREYLDKPIEEEKKKILDEYIMKLNYEYNTHVQVIYDNDLMFRNAKTDYGSFNGCKNVFALIGKDEEKCGYVGALLALKVQELELNSCFVMMTYRKGVVKKNVKIDKGEKLYCSIAFGYGKNNGVAHKSKTMEQVSKIIGEKSPYFDEVVKACLLAPTCLNQQRFQVVSNNGKIEVKRAGLGIHTTFDLGILKCHKDLVLKDFGF